MSPQKTFLEPACLCPIENLLAPQKTFPGYTWSLSMYHRKLLTPQKKVLDTEDWTPPPPLPSPTLHLLVLMCNHNHLLLHPPLHYNYVHVSGLFYQETVINYMVTLVPLTGLLVTKRASEVHSMASRVRLLYFFMMCHVPCVRSP